MFCTNFALRGGDITTNKKKKPDKILSSKHVNTVKEKTVCVRVCVHTHAVCGTEGENLSFHLKT